MNAIKDVGCLKTDGTGQDLAFFSRMSASISHEIKNCLAVISEQNGLHQDLLMLQHQGRPLVPERIEKIARTIAEQVQRMDAIIKRLNRFSHSPDTACGRIDLKDICVDTVELCRRFAVNRGITLTCEGESGLCVQGQSFALLRLLVECLESVFARSSSGDVVRLVLRKGQRGPVIAIMPPLEHTPHPVKRMADTMGLAIVRTEEGTATQIVFHGV